MPNSFTIWTCLREKRETFLEAREDIVAGLSEKRFTSEENFHHRESKCRKKLHLRSRSRPFLA